MQKYFKIETETKIETKFVIVTIKLKALLKGKTAKKKVSFMRQK